MVFARLRTRFTRNRQRNDIKSSLAAPPSINAPGEQQARETTNDQTTLPAIFISYARTDRERVDEIARHLSNAGFPVWYDRYLTEGEEWWNTILAQLRGCTIFMPLVSYALLDSQACHKEYLYAMELKRKIIPMLADQLDYHVLPWNLMRYEGFELKDVQLDQLGAKLEKVEAIPLPDPLPEPPALPLSPIGQMHDRIMAESLTEKEQASLFLRLKYLQRVATERDEATKLLALLRNQPWLYPGLADAIDAVLLPHVKTAMPQIPLSISVEPDKGDEEADGYYRVINDEHGVVATLRVPLLDQIAQGGPITSSWYFAPLPRVNIRLVNNTPQTVLFTEAILRVERSTADMRPTLVCWSDRDDGALLRIDNRGWGMAQDITLSFNTLVDALPKDKYSFDPAQQALLNTVQPYTGRYTHSYHFDAIDKEQVVDVSAALCADGFAASIAPQEFFGELATDVQPEQPEVTMASLRQDDAAIIYGELHYRSVAGEVFHYRFYEKIALQPRFAMYSRIGPPTDYYHALLRTDSGPYEVAVPLTQFVRPGDADWFGIEVAAPRSSHHQLSITMYYNEGESLTSVPLTLGIIVPRTANHWRQHHQFHMQEIEPLETWK